MPAGWKGVPNRSKPMQRHVRAQRPSQVDTQERFRYRQVDEKGQMEAGRRGQNRSLHMHVHIPTYTRIFILRFQRRGRAKDTQYSRIHMRTPIKVPFVSKILQNLQQPGVQPLQNLYGTPYNLFQTPGNVVLALDS